MKTIAEILKNRVRIVFEAPDDIQFPTDAVVDFIDITDMNPQPAEGDYYETGNFIFADDNPVKIDKTQITANGQDTIIIFDLEDRTEIQMSDVGFFDVEDGEFSFTIDSPGTYNITIKTFPYNPKEFTINAR